MWATHHQLWYILTCVCLVKGLALPSIGNAKPREDAIPSIRAASDEVAAKSTSIAGGIPLRVMPLGASITFGLKSTDGNGYRKVLRDDLTAAGNLVNMVGSHPNGTMLDNDSEGWPSFIIDEVHAKASANVPQYKPNMILINAGTNDCTRNIDIPNAGGRMSNMLDDLYRLSPGTTIVLSTLLVNGDKAAEPRIEQYNSQLRSLVTTRQSQGQRIVLAEMQSSVGPTTAELVDGTHPTDAGYVKMANIWFAAVKDAAAKGFLAPPQPVAGIPDDGVAQGEMIQA
ncbi:SGNH hydrolase-type esterase domain-containing protein [Xylariaceae sp. FL0016]|nr:SGNH hydrolase-type esterase domain-containing protein [Xylariaceae sp. FL0016]